MSARLALLPLLLWAIPAAAFDRLVLTFDDPDTSTTSAVRLYTDTPLQKPVLHFKAAGGEARRVEGEERFIAGADRWVYAFALRGLKPGVLQRFRVADGRVFRTATRTFKTLPKDADQIRFAVGGDVDVSRRAVDTWARVRSSFPDVVMLGGDLAYANGNPSAKSRWDTLLSHYESAMTYDKRMTHIVAAIGNHEVRGTRAPFWFAVFGTPGEASYFARDIGGVRVLALDTDHIAPHDGEQLEWIQGALRAEATWRMALYHVPLFPSHRSFTIPRAVAGRTHWLPVFARVVDVAFENHEHTLKRTTQEGVLFVGDGAWGRAPRAARKREYLEVSEGKTHVWIVDVQPDSVYLRALSPTGELLDKALIVRE